MPETTFLLRLAGCRRDYLTPENAPFLHALMSRSLTASIEPPHGFAPATAMLTGTFPDTSGAFSAFAYEPERSPFRWVGRLGPVNRLYQPRKALFPFRAAVKHLSRWTSGQQATDPAWIPGPHLAGFAAVARDDAALPFHRLAPRSGKDDEVLGALAQAIRGGDHPLLFAELTALDRAGRRHGPIVPDGHTPAAEQTEKDREQVRAAIRDVDRVCREAHEALAARHERFHFLVVGDHGMAPVMEKVDLLGEIEQLPLRPGRDHTLFVHGTLASLWFHTERAEEEIVSRLTDVTYGRIVGRDERRERRIPTDRKHGDLLFAADPGVLFWPDYFHAVERGIKGAQGYLDKALVVPPRGGADTWGAETPGVAILASPAVESPRDLGLRSLVDVLPTVCRLAGLDVPRSNEGRSLLEDPDAIAA